MTRFGVTVKFSGFPQDYVFPGQASISIGISLQLISQATQKSVYFELSESQQVDFSESNVNLMKNVLEMVFFKVFSISQEIIASTNENEAKLSSNLVVLRLHNMKQFNPYRSSPEQVLGKMKDSTLASFKPIALKQFKSSFGNDCGSLNLYGDIIPDKQGLFSSVSLGLHEIAIPEANCLDELFQEKFKNLAINKLQKSFVPVLINNSFKQEVVTESLYETMLSLTVPKL